MNNKTIPIILILSLLIFMGADCGKKTTASTGPYTGGTSGISIAFVESSPTAEFSKSDSMPVKVLVKNNGEYTVPSGQVKAKIYGVYHKSFGLVDQYKATITSLEGISKIVDEGAEQELNLGTINYKEAITNFQESTLMAKVCYPYETNVQFEGCIGSSKGLAEGKEQVCAISGEKLGSGMVSGAPVQVTSILQESYAADQVKFLIAIENVGGGDIYDLTETCEKLEESSKDIIKIEIQTPQDVQCSFLEGEAKSGTIRLKENKKILSCKKKAESDETIKQLIKFKISYHYTDSTSKTVKIYEG